MALITSAVGPPQSGDPSAARRGPSVRYEAIVSVAVWTFVACGAVALIEPSPYDFASFVAIPLWAIGGFTIHRSFVVFYFLLVLFAVFGFLALLPYWNNSDAVVYQYQTAYLTVTGLFFALYVADRAPARGELILKGYVAGALIASLCGVIGYFDIAGLGETFSRYGRASGTFKDPNVLGSFVILAALYLTAESPVASGAQLRRHASRADRHRSRHLPFVFARIVGGDDLLHGVHDGGDLRDV